MDKRTKEYMFFWFIENYSYCLHRNKDSLVSPEFTGDGLEGTKWTIRLYPRGCSDEDKGHISLFLSRSDNDAGPGTFLLKYELSVLARNGLELSGIRTEHGFEKGSAYGSQDFLSMYEVLLRRKSEYLPEDTLSVRCRIWNGEGSLHRLAPICARTRIGIEKVAFLHIAEGFSDLKPNQRKTVQVHPDAKNGCALSCSLYLSDREERVMVDIVPSDKSKVLSKCNIYLLSASGNIMNCGEADSRPDIARKDIERVSLTLTKDAIMERRGEYLTDDTLSLLCKCTFHAGLEFQRIEGIQHGIFMVSTSGMGNSAFCKVAQKLSACPSALEDLRNLYNDQLFADLEIKTATKSFRAHKIVLCARSPVFHTMMEIDMAEKESDSILVEDLDDDTVQQLLLFLYSDTLEDLHWDSAAKLFYAADKYQIEKLKLVCASFLIDNLTVATAPELLLLADTHNDSLLREVAENFVLQNEEQVVGSEEWECFTVANPQLALRAMRLRYQRKSK